MAVNMADFGSGSYNISRYTTDTSEISMNIHTYVFQSANI